MKRNNEKKMGKGGSRRYIQSDQCFMNFSQIANAAEPNQNINIGIFQLLMS